MNTLKAFPKRYRDAYSSVEQTRLMGSLGSDLVVAILLLSATGGAGAVEAYWRKKPCSNWPTSPSSEKDQTQAEVRWQHPEHGERQYDPLGNRTVTTLPGGQQLNFEYNHQGLFTALDINGQRLTQLERNTLGQEVFRSQGNLFSGFDYDPAGRLTRQWAQHHNTQHAVILEWAKERPDVIYSELLLENRRYSDEYIYSYLMEMYAQMERAGVFEKFLEDTKSA